MVTCDAEASGTTEAKVAIYTGNGPLYFCFHHYEQYRDVFIANKWLMIAVHPRNLPDPKVTIVTPDVPFIELYSSEDTAWQAPEDTAWQAPDSTDYPSGPLG